MNYSCVIQAVEDGDGKKLSKLLTRHIGGKLPKQLLAVSLLESASKGNESCITALLKAGANPGYVDEEGRTALIVLVEKAGATPPIAKKLLQAGCPVDYVTVESGQSALHICAKKGYQVCARLLIQCGAGLDIQDRAGNTPLALAARFGHLTICRSLIAAGVRTSRTNELGETPLHLAARRGCHQVTLDLLESGCEPDSRDHRRQTPLLVASRYRQTEVVKVLVESQAQVNAQDIHLGCTALHWASMHGDCDALGVLLDAGAGLDVRDKDWRTPFLVALQHNQVSAAELLLASGCDVTATDKTTCTGLHTAAKDGHASLIPKLLTNTEGVHGLDIDLRGGVGGKTALMLACGEAKPEVVAILLRYGAKVNCWDRSRATALVHCLLASVQLKREKTNLQPILTILASLIRSNCGVDDGCYLAKTLQSSSWNQETPMTSDSSPVGANKQNSQPQQQQTKLPLKLRSINPDKIYTPIEIAFLLELEFAGKMLLQAGARVPSYLTSGSNGSSPNACVNRLMRALRAPRYSRGVSSLKSACRRRILRSLGTSIREKLQTLPPLDYETRQYLRFAELDDAYDDDEEEEEEVDYAYGRGGVTTPGRNGGHHTTHATSAIHRGGQLRSTFAGTSGIPTTATGRIPALSGVKGRRERTTSTCSQASGSSSGGSTRTSSTAMSLEGNLGPRSARSSLRKPKNSTKYSISGRVSSNAATNATSPATTAIDYSDIYRKHRSPFDGPAKTASSASNIAVQRVSPLRQSSRQSAAGNVSPFSRKNARQTPATPTQTVNAPIKDRTLSADNGYVSTDSESTNGDRCGVRRVAKARSAVVSLADMCGRDEIRSERERALDDARTAHRNSLNREADEFARKSDVNNNYNNTRRNTFSSATPQQSQATPTRMRSGSYSSRGSTFDLDVLSPVLNVIESEESRTYSSPPTHATYAARPDTLHVNKDSLLRQPKKQNKQVHQASVNISKDWANSLRSSSARTAPTTPLGKVTPLGNITPRFGGSQTTKTPPTNLKTTPTLGSQRELANRLSQSVKNRSTPPTNTGSTQRRHVDPLSPMLPLQSSVIPQRRGQRLTGGQSSLQLSNRTKFNSESEDESPPFSRVHPQRASLRVTGSRSMLSVNHGHKEEPTEIKSRTQLSDPYYSDYDQEINPFKRSETFPANRPSSKEFTPEQRKWGQGDFSGDFSGDGDLNSSRERAYLGARTKAEESGDELQRRCSNPSDDSKYEIPTILPYRSGSKQTSNCQNDVLRNSKLDQSLMLALENEREDVRNSQREVVSDTQRDTVGDNNTSERLHSPVIRRPSIPVDMMSSVRDSTPLVTTQMETDRFNRINIPRDLVKDTSSPNPTSAEIPNRVANANEDPLSTPTKCQVDDEVLKPEPQRVRDTTHADSPMVSSRMTSPPSYAIIEDSASLGVAKSSMDSPSDSSVKEATGRWTRQGAVETRRKLRTQASEDESFSSRIAKTISMFESNISPNSTKNSPTSAKNSDQDQFGSQLSLSSTSSSITTPRRSMLPRPVNSMVRTAIVNADSPFQRTMSYRY